MLEICNENDNICFMPSLNVLFCIALKLTEVCGKLEVVSGLSESIIFSLAEQSEGATIYAVSQHRLFCLWLVETGCHISEDHVHRGGL